jgi:hypothetical protein
MIRDISRSISYNKRVIIIDSSCEISGFSGDHYSIGESRVMQVPLKKKQEEIMIQAIENHTPEVLIVDEIGSKNEVESIKNCSQRGVILYASAHGSLKNLKKNPILKDLMGGIEYASVSDSSLKKGDKKVQAFTKSGGLFDYVIELTKIENNLILNIFDVTDDLIVEKIIMGANTNYQIRELDFTQSKYCIYENRVDQPIIKNKPIEIPELAIGKKVYFMDLEFTRKNPTEIYIQEYEIEESNHENLNFNLIKSEFYFHKIYGNILKNVLPKHKKNVPLMMHRILDHNDSNTELGDDLSDLFQDSKEDQITFICKGEPVSGNCSSDEKIIYNALYGKNINFKIYEITRLLIALNSKIENNLMKNISNEIKQIKGEYCGIHKNLDSNHFLHCAKYDIDSMTIYFENFKKKFIN